MRSTFTQWYQTKMNTTETLSAETDCARKLLSKAATIAIVGLSRSFYKDSQFVGRYLQNAGYNIIPVNPGADEILGKKAYPDLKSIPFEVDIVDVFLPEKLIPQAVDQALEIHTKAIWLQLGTGFHPHQKVKAAKADTPLFVNRCIKADHQFLIRPKTNNLN